MSKPDELLVDVATMVESGQSNQMSLTVVVGGTVITGRLAPEAVWRRRVAEVLTDSAQLGEFSGTFTASAPATSVSAAPATSASAAFSTSASGSVRKDGPPTHLHFHVARILQGTVGIPETGGMYRVSIEDVGAWTVGDFSYH